MVPALTGRMLGAGPELRPQRRARAVTSWTGPWESTSDRRRTIENVSWMLNVG